MTRSKLIGRGGARPGAGRPPKPTAPPTATNDAPVMQERVTIIPTGLSEDALKKFCEDLAFETLANVAANGSSESARVAASRELLDRARGKPPASPAKPKQEDLFDDWGQLLNGNQSSEAAKRTN